jgi:hypothetical protein
MMNVLTRWTAACVAIAVLAAFTAAQDEDAEPGQKVRDRAAKDVALLLPQVGVGGSPTAKVDGDPGSPKQFKIEEEGCEKMKGFVIAPHGLDKNRKFALVFAFVSSFWRAEDLATDMKDVSVMTDSRDPLIVCAIQTSVITKQGDTTNIESAPLDACRAAYAWTLKKMMKDHPVDPARVFLVGVYGSTRDAVRWACHLWAEEPDAFPFRAILVDGVVHEDVDSMPPVPLIITVDKELDARSKRAGSDASRGVVNQLMARGIPCQFHVYEDKSWGYSSLEYWAS